MNSANPLELKTLGNKVSEFQGFDTFPSPKGIQEVKFTSSEVTAVCPMTGQPDFYTITVTYVPNRVCVESKSVKLYFQQFRNHGEFAEAFSRRIALDFLLSLRAESVVVELNQVPRGGWGISVVCDLDCTSISEEEIRDWNGGFLTREVK